ncbi:hypothetical protein BC830DRAFT_1110984 [Chytriomyces sp. MP71]|nr:hypothetical protein BC830DRAFT_1110984 [Chytriomyces sp. MP71]
MTTLNRTPPSPLPLRPRAEQRSGPPVTNAYSQSPVVATAAGLQARGRHPTNHATRAAVDETLRHIERSISQLRETDAASKSTWHEYLLVVTALCVLLLAINVFVLAKPPLPSSVISEAAYTRGRKLCEAHVAQATVAQDPEPTRINHRVATLANTSVLLVNIEFNSEEKRRKAPNDPLLIQHATVWDGAGSRFQDMDILIAYGVILKVAPGISLSKAVKVANGYAQKVVEKRKEEGKCIQPWDKAIHESHFELLDVQGRVVSPGIVDMHSHAGMSSIPGFEGTSDVNEDTDSPVNPQLRAKDAFNPDDLALDLIVSGGVTTSLILPGSGTVMGGEGFGIKLAKTARSSVADMEVDAGLAENGNRLRWMKMACGENTKSGWDDLGLLPGSRMGTAWLYRERFESAHSTLQNQDDWCFQAENLASLYGPNKAHLHISQRYPEPLRHDSLVALLRGQVHLHVHCYQTNDIEALLRHSREFDFRIAALHHATEAHLFADVLARYGRNLTVAIFADNSLYKREAYVHSVRAAQTLHARGVRVAFKSDHPVLDSRGLLYEAQKAAAWGLEEDVAFAAVTSVPAGAMGLGDRVGRVAEGFDADLVVWDREPLRLGARPLRVVVDGYSVFQAPIVLEPEKGKPPVPQITPLLSIASVLDAYTVNNIGALYANESATLADTKVIVEKGVVTCLGAECASKGMEFNLNGGVIIPGLIAAGVELGLKEISSEGSTRDGFAATADSIEGFVKAKDGLRVGGRSKALEYAHRGGVLTAITAPSTTELVGGVSVAFRTGAEVYREAVLKQEVALHVGIGDARKELFSGTVSTQIGRLRSLLSTPSPNSPFVDVVNGTMPLAVTAHDPNDISKLLSLKNAFPKLRLVLMGGTGAWTVADEIAKADVPLVLTPIRCQANSWETRWCKYAGNPGPSSFEVLKQAGVRVSFSFESISHSRLLLWEAGWATLGDSTAVGVGKVDVRDAVGGVTWRVADAFGLEGIGRIGVGKKASFLGLDGGPIGFEYSFQILADGDFVSTLPQQD